MNLRCLIILAPGVIILSVVMLKVVETTSGLEIKFLMTFSFVSEEFLDGAMTTLQNVNLPNDNWPNKSTEPNVRKLFKFS